MLDWGKLLSTERVRGSQKEDDGRNQMEADYDRIVGSSSVRRLQDKAQVYPLQKNDFVRTRLTHSMEVSAMARSMAQNIGRKLETKGIFDRKQTEMFAALLQTAGLIHDLGNPPFGHYGETVIRNWYKELIDNQNRNKKDGEKKELEKDFLYFDGNVQNLRIVSKLQTMNDPYGANFTYATMASIIKYPYCSEKTKNKKNKFGYFKSEEKLMKNLWKATGLSEGVRHPAVYILEAADDIIYTCDDIEDGVKKGYVDWNDMLEKLKNKIDISKYDLIINFLNSHQPDERMEENEKTMARVRIFRNYVQSMLLKSAIDCFFNNYDTIMEGKFGLNELLSYEVELVSVLKDICKENCYCTQEVLRLELAGDKVIKGLLNVFYGAVSKENISEEDIASYEGKALNIISANYKYIAKTEYFEMKDKKNEACWGERGLDSLSEYDKIQLVIDFVSGMTDSYAVDLYKQLMGISIA